MLTAITSIVVSVIHVGLHISCDIGNVNARRKLLPLKPCQKHLQNMDQFDYNMDDQLTAATIHIFTLPVSSDAQIFVLVLSMVAAGFCLIYVWTSYQICHDVSASLAALAA
jgi:hypothetical protein